MWVSRGSFKNLPEKSAAVLPLLHLLYFFFADGWKFIVLAGGKAAILDHEVILEKRPYIVEI